MGLLSGEVSMKVGDLVKAKPGTAEGDVEKLGLGIIVREDPVATGPQRFWVKWLNYTNGKPWARYEDELELIESRPMGADIK
tara:strand:+ start:2930 stop:3175 length:246 start_codon:yes stop_codon:yes gene_type:complete